MSCREREKEEVAMGWGVSLGLRGACCGETPKADSLSLAPRVRLLQGLPASFTNRVGRSDGEWNGTQASSGA